MDKKLVLLRELLTQNPAARTTDLNDEIQKKLGKKVTPSMISEIRAKEFGVRIGPRGKIERISKEPHVPAPHPESTPEVLEATGPVSGNAVLVAFAEVPDMDAFSRRASAIIRQLQHLMETANLNELRVTPDGVGVRTLVRQADGIREVRQALSLERPN